MSTQHLYQDQPYVVMGSAETLDDFVLFVQGRIQGQWMNIKKNVSFLSARKGNHSLRAGYAQQAAYALYERYIYENNHELLAEARLLLEPFDSKIALE